jgi:hypothetical protein
LLDEGDLGDGLVFDWLALNLGPGECLDEVLMAKFVNPGGLLRSHEN